MRDRMFSQSYLRNPAWSLLAANRMNVYLLVIAMVLTTGVQKGLSRDTYAAERVKVNKGSKTKPTRQIKAPYAVEKPLSAPRIFAEGIISTSDDEFNVSFTPDGKAVYFTKSVVRSYLYTICVSHFERGKWGTPEVATFSGFYRDWDTFVAPDGSTLYFVSDRPLPGVREGNNVDIWMVDKTAAGWGEPRNIGQPVNSDAAETYPTLTSDGTIYFSSTRAGGKGEADIYRSRLINGKYTSPENLGDAVNSSYNETEAYVARDESFIIFTSNRPGGLGSFDLYVSYKRAGGWTKAVNLGPQVNSEGYDLNPTISPDDKYFFFVSDRGFATAPLGKRLDYGEIMTGLRSVRNGFMNIYQVEVGALNLER